MDVRKVYMVPCALQLQREDIAVGCKAPVWIKWSSVSELESGESAVTLRRNCIDGFCMQYERSGCKSLHGEYDESRMECAKDCFKA